MKDIAIIGAGGFGREVAWLIEDINKQEKQWNIVGFVDDDDSIQGMDFNGYKVVGNVQWLADQEVYVVCAVGNPAVKKKILQRLENSKNRYPVLIHPSVIRSETGIIGEGSLICAGNIISVNTNIGRHVIINLDCTIGHDAVLCDYATILPSVNISGAVTIGECANIGTGSAVIQELTIGENTIVGAGSVVIRDLPSNCTAVGSPAKPIKFNS